MPAGDPLHDAVRELGSSKRAYGRLLNKPAPDALSRCDACHARLVQLMEDKLLVQCVDDRIQWAHENDYATVDKALHTLDRLRGDVLEFEREVGTSIGFNRRQMSKLINEATNNLKRAQSKGVVPPAPRSTAELLERVEALHGRSSELVQTHPQGGSARRKRKKKSEARHHVVRQLLLVSSIVANGRYHGYFHYSFAISFGLAAGEP